MKKFIIINGKEVRTINAENMEGARTKAINTCDHSKEIIVREIEAYTEVNKFSNGFDDWQETHYEIVEELSNQLASEDKTNLATRTISQQGTGGLYILSKRLTDEFEEQHKGVEWGEGEHACYRDSIEEFMNNQHFVETEQGSNAEKFLNKQIKTAEIANNTEVVEVTCPHCDHWEQHPIDQQRKQIQTFDILKWEEDQKDKPEESKMKCHSCKGEFNLHWTYDKNEIK